MQAKANLPPSGKAPYTCRIATMATVERERFVDVPSNSTQSRINSSNPNIVENI
jgi:hypothetical protein